MYSFCSPPFMAVRRLTGAASLGQTYAFPFTTFPRRRPFTRSFGDKLHEIALRSPKDSLALERLADLVIKRLNAENVPPLLKG